jgi:predicted RNase H-like HicB family nuclease
MDFQIRGAWYAIEPEEIIRATRSVQPNATDGRNKYFVALHGRQYPIKQVIQLVTGLASPVFTAQYAYRILSRLGFEISERPDETVYGRPPRAPNTELEGSEPPPEATVVIDTGDDAEQVLNLLVLFETDEDGWEVVSCPTLPGCHSQGRTRDEALANIREAIRGYLASMREHGEPLPSSSTFQVLEVPV